MPTASHDSWCSFVAKLLHNRVRTYVRMHSCDNLCHCILFISDCVCVCMCVRNACMRVCWCVCCLWLIPLLFAAGDLLRFHCLCPCWCAHPIPSQRDYLCYQPATLCRREGGLWQAHTYCLRKESGDTRTCA